MALTTYGTRIDVRELAPRERHPLIFNTFRSLGPGETMEIINDHDPKPLFYQFQAELPGRFSWDYLQNGPQTWRVRIAKLGGAGGCGGGRCGCAGG